MSKRSTKWYRKNEAEVMQRLGLSRQETVEQHGLIKGMGKTNIVCVS